MNPTPQPQDPQPLEPHDGLHLMAQCAVVEELTLDDFLDACFVA